MAEGTQEDGVSPRRADEFHLVAVSRRLLGMWDQIWEHPINAEISLKGIDKSLSREGKQSRES